MIDQRWLNGDSVGSGGSGDTLGTATDRFQYGYDADSNVLYKNNLLSSTNSELYHGNGSSNPYDNLNRLVEFQRGTLSTDHTSLTGTAGRDQVFNLDTLGNWDGTNAIKTNGTGQARSHNARNEYTAVGGNTPTYDNNGNLTKDENGQQYVYDAWNRLVTVKNSAGTVTDTYAYDGFGRRIKESPAGSTATDLYLDTSGRVLEERQGSTVTRQYVFGLGYPNDLVLRDDNTGSTNNYGTATSGLHTRLYVQQDANFNVTSLIDTSAAVQERYQYDPYGTVTVLTSSFTVRGTGAPSASLFSWQYLFQGGRLDTTSLLYHFDARDYSTTLGRWLQTDSSGYVDGANLYQLERGNPVEFRDPTGHGTVPPPGPGTRLWNDVSAWNIKNCELDASSNTGEHNRGSGTDEMQDNLVRQHIDYATELVDTLYQQSLTSGDPWATIADASDAERALNHLLDLQQQLDDCRKNPKHPKPQSCPQQNVGKPGQSGASSGGGTQGTATPLPGRPKPSPLPPLPPAKYPWYCFGGYPSWAKGGRKTTDIIDNTAFGFFIGGITVGSAGVAGYFLGAGSAAAVGGQIAGRIGPAGGAIIGGAMGQQAAAGTAPTTQPSPGYDLEQYHQ